MIKLLLVPVFWMAVAGLFSACQSSPPDCSTAPDVEASGDIYPNIGFPTRTDAEELVHQYLRRATCEGQLPEHSRFEPFFFKASELDMKYELLEFNEGFGKQPSSVLVGFDNGLSLLFCFNRMVINCNKAQRCICPYDFNKPPEARDL